MIDTRHADGGSGAVSEGRVSVAGMSTHVCVWFEDTWPEHGCDCGARAVMIIEEDSSAVLVELDTSRDRAEEALPISA